MHIDRHWLTLSLCAAACLGPRAPECKSSEGAYAFELPAALPRATTLLEAEAASTTGSVSVFSTALHTPGAEASGRRHVSLASGQSLTWKSTVSGDGLVVRYSYPDAADGSGQDGALELRVNGTPVAKLPVTSRYSWEYGKPNWGTADVWSSDPGRGSPRHFWDESSLALPRPIAGGESVTLVNPAASGNTVLIDFVELENVAAPLAAPAGSLSLSEFQPAADGVKDDTDALARALAEAGRQKRVLYVPAGTYRVASLEISSGTLQGAGMWQTRFVGPQAQLRFGGGRAKVADLAIFGETSKRNDHSDEGNAFAGRPGPGSSLERIWVEHMKCAFWVSNAGEERGPSELRITGCRFRNLMADAVNLCNGTTQSLVDNNDIRNSGDDALAAWSPSRTPAGGYNTFAHNTIQSPWVASGIALYGGGPFRVVGNSVADTVTTGSGIYVSANFAAHPFRGLVDIHDNVLTRSGAHESDPGGPTGAIRVLAADGDMTQAEFSFRDNKVIAPLESAVSIQGPRRISGLRFDGLLLEDAPLVADVRPGARGEAVFARISSAAGKPPDFRNPEQRSFVLTH